jgi:hypothetical protein
MFRSRPGFVNHVRKLLAGLLVCSCLLQSQKTDHKVYAEPAAPPLPPAGKPFTDPTFGTTLMRLTSDADGIDCRNQYSFWPTFNFNSTRLFITCSYKKPGENWNTTDTLLYRFDPENFKILKKEVLNLWRAGAGAPDMEDAIWSGSEPDTLYAHDAAVLYAINVANKKLKELKDFGDLFPGRRVRQMSKSANDDIFAFSVQNQGDPDWGTSGFFAWSRSRNQILIKEGNCRHDEVHIDKTGRYLTVNAMSGVPNIQNRVYDLETGKYEDLTDGPPDYAFDHSDYGTGIAVGFENWTPRITVRKLGSPHKFETIQGPIRLRGELTDFSQSVHVSLLADDESWALVSYYLSNKGESSKLYRNEIVLIATDGSGRVRRLAHHHSVFRDDYWDSPRANISKDGRFVAFTSNWGGGARRDVFLLRVPREAAQVSSDRQPPPREPGSTGR